MHIFDFFRDIFSVFGAFSRFFWVKNLVFENPASVKEESGQVYCLKAILLPINCRKMELFPRGVATDQTAPRRPFPVQSQGISSHSLVALARTLEYFLPLKL